MTTASAATSTDPSASATTDDRPGTLLVTGGAGYIGSHTVHHLARRHERIVVLDTSSSVTRRRCNWMAWI